MYRATEKDQPAQSPPSDTLTASNMEEITAETLLHIESLVSWLTAVDFLIFYGLQFEGIKDPGCWPWSTDKPYRDPCRGKIP